MINFVIAAGRPDAIDRALPRLRRATDATTILAAERVEHRSSDMTWALVADVVDDPTCHRRIAIDGSAVVVVNGPALARRGPTDSLTDDALSAFVGRGEGASAAMADVLGGTYCVVGCSPTEGLRAFTDFSGLYTLYWRETPDLLLVSNRSTTVAEAAGSSGWDLDVLAWQIGLPNLVGDRVPAAGVAKLPAGIELRTAPGSQRCRLVRGPTWVWPDPDDTPVDRLGDGEWDEVTDALVANMASAATGDGPLRMQLTGGKDSRLGLAVALGAGLGDRVFTVTNGAPDNPEVEAAAAVAAAAGVPHERVGISPARAGAASTAPAEGPGAPGFVASGVWRRLRQQVFRYQGIVCPWDGMTDPLRGTGTTIKGFGAELYRQPPPTRVAPTTSPEEMARQFAASVPSHDVLGVLHPHVVERQRAWLETWFRQTRREVALQHVAEKFYVDFQLGHWTGPLAQCVPTRVSVLPLVSSAASRLNLRLTTEERTRERLHYEVMRRLAPEVAAVPFLGDTWAPEIIESSPLPLAREPLPTRVEASSRSLTSWQWTFLEHERARIDALFADAQRHTAMGEICDMGLLRSTERHTDRMASPPAARKLLSAISVALLLLGRAEPFVDVPG